MTFAQFSKVIHIHRMTMSNISTRRTQRPGLNVLYSIAKHLNISVDLIMFGSDEAFYKKIDEVAMEQQVCKALSHLQPKQEVNNG
jgi:DNA-binding XRE family transcriptional regulator